VRGDALGPAVLTRVGAMGGVDLMFFDPPYPLVRDSNPGGGWERLMRQLERLVPQLGDAGFLLLRTPWPFRHPDVPEGAQAGAEGGAAAPARRERRGLAEGKRLEKEWIGDEVDIEAIERDTQRLQRQLERGSKRASVGNAGDSDSAGGGAGGRGPRGVKRHLTDRDLEDDGFLDDETAMEGYEDEGDEDAPGEHPHVQYHMVGLEIAGAVGPETHIYGSTAVHLYMKQRAAM